MISSTLELPSLTVEVNSRPLIGAERGSLGGIRVSQKLCLPTQCELTFFHVPEAELLSTLIPGTSLRVAADRCRLKEPEPVAESCAQAKVV